MANLLYFDLSEAQREQVAAQYPDHLMSRDPELYAYGLDEQGNVVSRSKVISATFFSGRHLTWLRAELARSNENGRAYSEYRANLRREIALRMELPNAAEGEFDDSVLMGERPYQPPTGWKAGSR